MAGYQVRLDRLEARVAPFVAGRPILLFMRDGDTEEHITQTYAEAHGLDVADLRNRACYVVFVTA
jgi:hypothetical protein